MDYPQRQEPKVGHNSNMWCLALLALNKREPGLILDIDYFCVESADVSHAQVDSVHVFVQSENVTEMCP